MKKNAFTLIEVTISIAMGMAMIAIAWSIFSRSKSAALRTRDRVMLHQSAANIREFLNRDFANMSPSIAMFIRSIPSVSLPNLDRTDTIEITFMRSVAPLGGASVGGSGQWRQDEHWVRWQFVRTSRATSGVWSAIGHTLYRSQSTEVRSWSTTSSLVPKTYLAEPGVTPPSSYDRLYFTNVPRALRDSSQGIGSLENNTYNIPSAYFNSLDLGTVMGDFGDLTDLNNNNSAVSNQVMDFRIGWVNASGQEYDVAMDSAADYRIDGIYMDILGPSGNDYKTQISKRPMMTRISFSMMNDAGTFTQPFTFCFAGPGMPPPVAP